MALTVHQTLELVGSTSSKNDKIRILKENDTPELRKTVQLAYDPYRLFYFTQLGDEVQLDCRSKPLDLSYILDSLMDAKTRDDVKRLILEINSHATQEDKALVSLILQRDLNCGIALSTINKAFPDMNLPDYKVAKAEEKGKLNKITYPAYVNVKIDGARATLFYNQGSVIVKSSSGRELQQIPDSLQSECDQFAKEMGQQSFILDGEFLHTEVPRQSSNGLFNKMLKGTANSDEINGMVYHVFDVLSFDTYEKGKCDISLTQRVSTLEHLFSRVETQTMKLVEYHIVYDENQVHSLNKMFLGEGEEGSVVKNMDSIYQCKRTADWVKLKQEIDVDLVVTGWTPHKKDPEQIGALLVESSDGKIASAIGTGKWLTQERRRELMKLAMDDELEGMILQCTIHDVTKNQAGEFSFNLPRIEEVRYDTEADSFEKIMDQIPECRRPV